MMPNYAIEIEKWLNEVLLAYQDQGMERGGNLKRQMLKTVDLHKTSPTLLMMRSCMFHA